MAKIYGYDISLPAKICISIEESKFVLESNNIEFESSNSIPCSIVLLYKKEIFSKN